MRERERELVTDVRVPLTNERETVTDERGTLTDVTYQDCYR